MPPYKGRGRRGRIPTLGFPTKGGGVRGNRRFPGKGVVGENLVSLQREGSSKGTVGSLERKGS